MYGVSAALRRTGHEIPIATSAPGNDRGVARAVFYSHLGGSGLAGKNRDEGDQNIRSANSNASASLPYHRQRINEDGNQLIISLNSPLSATRTSFRSSASSSTSSSTYSSAYPSSSPYPPSTSSSRGSPASPPQPLKSRFNVEMGMSARTALSMLSPPSSAEVSSSSFPFPPTSSNPAHNKSTTIKPPRRQSSLPPPRKLKHKPSREAIGCPPSVPLPPLPPSTPSRNGSLRSMASASTMDTNQESIYELGTVTPRASLRSSRSHSHVRKVSDASLASAQTRNSVAPSLSEFGGRPPGFGHGNENAGQSMRSREKARAKLRIDIPPSYTEETTHRAEYVAREDYKNTRRKSSVASVSSSVTPDTNAELEREFGTIGKEMGFSFGGLRSPTGSEYSVGSTLTSRSGTSGRTMSSAQSLKQRVKGMLGSFETPSNDKLSRLSGGEKERVSKSSVLPPCFAFVSLDI